MRLIRSTPSKAAFTLVELLVVIGIIAVLVAILLPALNRARAQGRKAKCMSNLRQLGQACSIYAAENKGSMPWGFQFANYYGGSISGADFYDWVSMLDYVMASKSRPNGYLGGSDATTTDVRYPVVSDVFVDPEVITDSNSGTHYGVHPVVFPNYFLEVLNSFTGQPFSGDSLGRAGGRSAPAKLNTIYPDNLLMWDAHALGDSYRSAWVFSSYSSIDNRNLVAFNGDPQLRFRIKGRDVYAATANKGQHLPIWLPRPADPNQQEQFNYDVFGEFIRVEQFNNIRFRHNGNTEANALMGDFSVQSFKFDKKKAFPHPGGAGSYFVDIRRYQLRLKKPSY